MAAAGPKPPIPSPIVAIEQLQTAIDDYITGKHPNPTIMAFCTVAFISIQKHFCNTDNLNQLFNEGDPYLPEKAWAQRVVQAVKKYIDYRKKHAKLDQKALNDDLFFLAGIFKEGNDENNLFNNYEVIPEFLTENIRDLLRHLIHTGAIFEQSFKYINEKLFQTTITEEMLNYQNSHFINKLKLAATAIKGLVLKEQLSSTESLRRSFFADSKFPLDSKYPLQECCYWIRNNRLDKSQNISSKAPRKQELEILRKVIDRLNNENKYDEYEAFSVMRALSFNNLVDNHDLQDVQELIYEYLRANVKKHGVDENSKLLKYLEPNDFHQEFSYIVIIKNLLKMEALPLVPSKDGKKQNTLLFYIKQCFDQKQLWYIDPYARPHFLHRLFNIVREEINSNLHEQPDMAQSPLHALIKELLNYLNTEPCPPFMEQYYYVLETKHTMELLIAKGANIYAAPHDKSEKSIMALVAEIPQLTAFLERNFKKQTIQNNRRNIEIADACVVPIDIAKIISYLSSGNNNFLPDYKSQALPKEDNVSVHPAYGRRKPR